MKKRSAIVLVFLLNVLAVAAQTNIKVYPSHWWAGMKNASVQLMFHAPNANSNKSPAGVTVKCSSRDITILKVNRVSNSRYVFVDIQIARSAKPQAVKFSFEGGGFAGMTKTFELKPRRKGNGTLYAQGVTSSDFMYLIMPDRFSNGNKENDKVPGMNDTGFSRDSMYFRHGGDLQGIRNHLDYLVELGVTALWLNPVIQNNMPRASYHGYAFTDHYSIDERLGGDAAYKELIDAMHAKKLKMVQDAVYNHVGLEHFFVKDQPTSDWLHHWPSYTNTTYKDQVLFDPYASEADKNKMSNGWFVPSMPDLNHSNPYVANFLIQHALWTVEEFGIDGWRVDTYAYNDLLFMNRCNKALLDEYPRLTIFGETWVHGVPNQSYFAQNNYNIPYKSNQPGITDFQLLWGIQDAMTKDFGWNDGVNKLYTTLAQDFVYKDPTQNVIFFDNHDISRFYSTIGEHRKKYFMSIGWLLTCRGVPQWYYGAEIGMKGFANPDGLVRMDFPGGWEGDKKSAFTAEGRTPGEDSIFIFTKKLANFRKQSSALKGGRLMQFVPEDGVYTYFRYNKEQTIMVVMNTSAEERTIDPQRYKERVMVNQELKDIMDGTTRTVSSTWKLPPHGIWIMEVIQR